MKSAFRLFALTLILATTLATVTYNYHFQYFLGPYRQAPLPPIYDQIQSWLSSQGAQGYKVLDLTHGSGADQLLARGYETLAWNYDDLVLRYYRSSEFAWLLGSLGVRFVIVSANTTPFNDDLGIYRALSNSQYLVKTNFNGTAPFILDILQHRIPPRISQIEIFENRLALPQIYAAQPALVLGGDAAIPVAFLPAEISGHARVPVLLSQESNLAELDELLHMSNELTFQDSNIHDLFALWSEDSIGLEGFASNGWDLVEHETFSNIPSLPHSIGHSLYGQLLISDFAITSSGREARLQVPFSVSTGGNYTIVLRVLLLGSFSSLKSWVDNEPASTLSGANSYEFRWITLFARTLTQGSHVLNLVVSLGTEAYLDAISIRPQPDKAYDAFVAYLSTFISKYNFIVDPRGLETSLDVFATIPTNTTNGWHTNGQQTIGVGERTRSLEWNFSSGPFQFIQYSPTQPLDLDGNYSLTVDVQEIQGSETTLSVWLIDSQGNYRNYDFPLSTGETSNKTLSLQASAGNSPIPLDFHHVAAVRLSTNSGNGTISIRQLRVLSMNNVVIYDRYDSPTGEFRFCAPACSVTVSIDVPRMSTYQLQVASAEGTPSALLVDGIKVQMKTPASHSYAIQQELDLPPGHHTISLVNGADPMVLKYVQIVEFPGDTPQANYDSKLIFRVSGPSSYEGQLNTTNPVLIVIPQTHFSGWQIFSDGRTQSPLVVLGFVMGFPVISPGNHKFTIQYRPTILAFLTSWISIGSFGASLALISKDRLVFILIQVRRRWTERQVRHARKTCDSPLNNAPNRAVHIDRSHCSVKSF